MLHLFLLSLFELVQDMIISASTPSYRSGWIVLIMNQIEHGHDELLDT